MKIVFDEYTSKRMVRCISAVIEEYFPLDPVKYVYDEFDAVKISGQWPLEAKKGNWAVISCEVLTTKSPQKIQFWKKLDIPIMFVSKNLLEQRPECRVVGKFLFYWPEIRRALASPGVKFFDGDGIKQK